MTNEQLYGIICTVGADGWPIGCCRHCHICGVMQQHTVAAHASSNTTCNNTQCPIVCSHHQQSALTCICTSCTIVATHLLTCQIYELKELHLHPSAVFNRCQDCVCFWNISMVRLAVNAGIDLNLVATNRTCHSIHRETERPFTCSSPSQSSLTALSRAYIDICLYV